MNLKYRQYGIELIDENMKYKSKISLNNIIMKKQYKLLLNKQRFSKKEQDEKLMKNELLKTIKYIDFEIEKNGFILYKKLGDFIKDEKLLMIKNDKKSLGLFVELDEYILYRFQKNGADNKGLKRP
jgi:hypothetical protein